MKNAQPHTTGLYVSIFLGVPENEFSMTDRFQVEGDPEMAAGFNEWWTESGTADIAAGMAESGHGYMLAGDNNGMGGGGDLVTWPAYMEWRDAYRARLDAMALEPALLVAA